MSAAVTAMAEKTRPVRITEEAIGLARIAASYTGESMSDYVCRVIIERAREDIDKGHAALKSERKPPKGK